MREKHSSKDPVGDESKETAMSRPALSVTIAKVQGFVENYTRYYHLTKMPNSSACVPFFAPDALDQLTEEDLDKAEEMAKEAEEAAQEKAQKNGTTVVVRNLPPAIKSSDQMRDWLMEWHTPEAYNFLLYMPPKGSRKAGAAEKAAASGYGFVNFLSEELSGECIRQLNAVKVPGCLKELSVVPSNVQGFQECMDHFKTLIDSKRCPAFLPHQTDALSTDGSGFDPTAETRGGYAFQ